VKKISFEFNGMSQSVAFLYGFSRGLNSSAEAFGYTSNNWHRHLCNSRSGSSAIKAMRSDWLCVGQDISHAIDEYGHDTTERADSAA
jgi:hypothetical protein